MRRVVPALAFSLLCAPAHALTLPAMPYAIATPEAYGARFEAGMVGRF